MPENPDRKFLIDSVARSKNSAFLLAGPPGASKKEAAEEIAKAVLGRRENRPDLIRIAPEKTSIKIEAIRELIRRLSLKPIEADRIVVMMEEADSMTESAANALLKTLEEPPSYVLFLLISAAPERLHSTIRSRCQRISFQISDKTLRKRFEGILPFWQENILPIFETSPSSFTQASELAEKTAKETDEIPPLFEILKAWWHDLAVYRETRSEDHLLLPNALATIRRMADQRDRGRIFEEIDLIEETERAIEGNVNKTLALERLFTRLTEI